MLARSQKVHFCSKVGKNKPKLGKPNPVVVVSGMTLVSFTHDQIVFNLSSEAEGSNDSSPFVQ